MSATDPLWGLPAVVVGGDGSVGRLFAELLRAGGAEVSVVDAAAESTAAPGPGCIRADVTDIDEATEQALRAAQLVVLAVPKQVALACVEAVAAVLRPGALVVDTLSVKSEIVAALRAHGGHLEALSLNPLFAPSLGIAGRRVAAVVVHDGPRARAFMRWISLAGGRIVEVSESEHDRVMGAAQALTHAAVLAFGAALVDLDVEIADLSELAPPPCMNLLGLLARITSGTPETYWDVQAANPHAAAARAALAGSAAALAGVVELGGHQEFDAMLAGLRERFGSDLSTYRDSCQQALQALHQTER